MATAVINDTVPGALPSQELEQITEPWFNIKPEKANIQPGSFDPPATDKCYRVSTSEGFKVPEGVSVEDRIKGIPKEECTSLDLSKEQIAAPGPQYLIHLGYVHLPKNFFIRSSPKSTQGRLGTYVKFIADGHPDFDEVEGPYEGNLWALFETHFFHIGIQAGDCLNQLRVFCRSSSKIEGHELMQEFYDTPLLYRDGKPVDVDKVNLSEGVPLTLDLEGKATDGIVGFKARMNPDPISLRAKDLDYSRYFEIVRRPDGGIIDIKDDEFYILASHEGVRVPGHLAMEMTQYHRRSGALRLHKAGFVDPYFGFGKIGELLGASIVSEVDTHEKRSGPLAHGQSIGLLEVQRLRRKAKAIYGEVGNTYQGQLGPRLAKQFKKIEWGK